MSAITIDQLREVGLLDNSPEPHLTDKGRNWLRALEDIEAPEQDLDDAAADLVLSTNGLFR